MSNLSFGVVDDDEDSAAVEESLPARVSVYDLLPSDKHYLSLDISKNSTGVTEVIDGEILWRNIKLNDFSGNVHEEALQRRDFRDQLLETIDGAHYDGVFVEDVYYGEFLTSIRVLSALNTVIDDLILDGHVSVAEGGFHRVPNTKWKSWLSEIDPGKIIRGANDKEHIRLLLRELGVESSGKGYQDRLDSLGMLVGYRVHELLQAGQADFTDLISSVPLIKFKELAFDYQSNEDDLNYPSGREVIPYTGRVDKQSVIREASLGDCNKVWVSAKRVSLGVRTKTFGVSPIPFGGYFAFWRTISK